MAGSPRYIGTNSGVVVKVIAVDSQRTWKTIQSATGFSEKELNYHLHILFNDQVLFKDGNDYYVIPELEAEYLAYYQTPPPKPETVSVPDTAPKIVKAFSFLNLKGLALIIILLLSLSLNYQSLSTYNNLQSQIEQQSNQIQTYTETIEELQNEIDNLNTQLETQEATNTALSQYIQTLESQITELQSEINSGTTDDSTSSSTTTQTVYIDKIGTVTRVIDGDTFELSNGKRVRLADIDAPESYDPGYADSTNALSDWILGKTVYLDVDDLYETDIYGRLVCVVYIQSGSGYTNINNALVNGGYAEIWDYSNEFNPSDWGTSGVFDTSEAVYETSTSSSSSSSSSSTSTGPYYASKNSDIYHKPSCYWAQQISPSNLIIFNSKSAAEVAGYRACQVCKP